MSDPLWQDAITGQVAIWLMNSAAIGSSGSLGSVPAGDWVVKGVGDFDGDGNADIL
jgi:hypothetical protein